MDKYKNKVSKDKSNSGYLIDWLGIKTDLKFFPWLQASNPNGLIISEIPVPDDKHRAETIEYVAVISALETAIQKKSQEFSVVELGASYGPWITVAGVLGKRANFKKINLKAVEAVPKAVSEIQAHLNRNEIFESQNVSIDLINAAVAIKESDMYFPDVDVALDNGGQASKDALQNDYRGYEIKSVKVRGLPLSKLVADLDQIDLLHMDLQGAEEELLNDQEFLSIIKSKVRYLFLATQSRLIEGIAIRQLHSLGLSLLRERPTDIKPNENIQDTNGWTIRDGGQIWFNKFV